MKGQLSDLNRKNAEIIALRFRTPPRTLLRFLEWIKWDEEKFRDYCQKTVARDHGHPRGIGVVDESGGFIRLKHTGVEGSVDMLIP